MNASLRNLKSLADLASADRSKALEGAHRGKEGPLVESGPWGKESLRIRHLSLLLSWFFLCWHLILQPPPLEFSAERQHRSVGVTLTVSTICSAFIISCQAIYCGTFKDGGADDVPRGGGRVAEL